MNNRKKEIYKSFIPTIVVCVLLILCTTVAIFLSGYDWHYEKILGSLSNVGTSAHIGTALSETDEPEEWDYFDDAVMVGDSITYGMASYGYLTFDHVFAKIGLHQGTALTSKCVYTSQTQGYSISEALEIAKPGKIYVTLGINAIYSYKSDSFYNNYRALISKIKTASPNSTIILQSIFPVTEQWAINNGKPNCNQAVAYANQKLSEIAKEESCLFLHTYEKLTDQNGFLQAEYSGDGIHLSRKGYEVVFNYILTHPVKSSGKFTAIGAIRPPAPQVSTSSQVTMPDLEDASSAISHNEHTSSKPNEEPSSNLGETSSEENSTESSKENSSSDNSSLTSSSQSSSPSSSSQASSEPSEPLASETITSETSTSNPSTSNPSTSSPSTSNPSASETSTSSPSTSNPSASETSTSSPSTSSPSIPSTSQDSSHPAIIE